MTAPRTVAVVDIGKSNAKLALVDLVTLEETAVRRTPNRTLPGPPYPHYDIDGLWQFILDGLAEFARRGRVDAVSVTTHGVAAALLDADGQPAFPVLDYEHAIPPQARDAYASVRPEFAETGSPLLPVGLNLGAQIHWQATAFGDEFENVRSIVTYPQYWSYRLTGVLGSEVTSLGCHSDLWAPGHNDYSSLVDRMGWRGLFPPLRRAHDRLGAILPEVAQVTGLSPDTVVTCGIHDSNASLLPHLLARKPPFCVVSTGTWVIAMAIGGRTVDLDPGRDTLINVNAFGNPVPSARFMGGREYAIAIGENEVVPAPEDIGAILASEIVLMPAVEPGSGPFQGRTARWHPEEPTAPGERAAAVSLYLAMMTATAVDLIGGSGPIVVEGPFAANRLYLRMLAAATGQIVLAASGATGTSVGAALLVAETTPHALLAGKETEILPEAGLAAYAEAWRARAV